MDSHCHLQHERFDPDREAVIDRAVAAGIERIMVPGWDLASSEAALVMADRHAPLIQAAVGVHPHHAGEMDERAWAELGALVADPRCTAVGEIGLDFFRNLSSPEAQHDAFARQLEMAAGHALPVLVHDRDAHEDITAALTAWSGRASTAARGVLHAFSGDAAMAETVTGGGFLVSFALPLSFRSAVGPRSAAAAIGAETYLVETDAPYLGPDRERRNEPTTVLRVATELARLRGVDPETVAQGARRAYEHLVA
ncbi:MAG: TatD family hydrolase [Candidatus Limnocylindria bacterium]